MSRKQRYTLVRQKQAQSRTENGHIKRDERVRREARIKRLLGEGKFPYTPAIRSWLSVKLDKPSTRITEADVQELLKA